MDIPDEAHCSALCCLRASVWCFESLRRCDLISGSGTAQTSVARSVTTASVRSVVRRDWTRAFFCALEQTSVLIQSMCGALKWVSVRFKDGSALCMRHLNGEPVFGGSPRSLLHSQGSYIHSGSFPETMPGAVSALKWFSMCSVCCSPLWVRARERGRRGGGAGNFPLLAAAEAAAGSFSTDRGIRLSSAQLSLLLCSAAGRGWQHLVSITAKPVGRGKESGRMRRRGFYFIFLSPCCHQNIVSLCQCVIVLSQHDFLIASVAVCI